MRYTVMAALVLALASTVVVAEEYNKDNDPWARYAVGSWAKYSMMTDMGTMKTEGEMTVTLDELTETGYTTLTKTVMTVMGQTQEQEQEQTQEFPVFDGNETLTIEGTEYPCTIWKQTAKSNGNTATSRMWQSAEGKPLKAASEGAQEFEIMATKVSDSVEACGKTFDCVKLQGKMNQGGMEMDFTMWMTKEIPGGAAKFEMAMQMQGMSVKTTVTAVEYEGKTGNY